MTAWIVMLALAGLPFLFFWRWVRPGQAGMQLVAAVLLVAFAGYAWQGEPGLAGSPKPPSARQAIPDGGFAALREDMLGRFDSASRWLIIAESYQRRGNTQAGARIIRAGLRHEPRNMDLWLGLGNALVLHGEGMVNPAAELAYRRAARLAPAHPAPPFFYGLALAQSGRFAEAEQVWTHLLETGPEGGEWRPIVEERLTVLRAIMEVAAPAPRR